METSSPLVTFKMYLSKNVLNFLIEATMITKILLDLRAEHFSLP